MMKLDPALPVAEKVLAATCILVAVVALRCWLGISDEAITVASVSVAVFSLYFDCAHHRKIELELDEIKDALRQGLKGRQEDCKDL